MRRYNIDMFVALFFLAAIVGAALDPIALLINVLNGLLIQRWWVAAASSACAIGVLQTVIEVADPVAGMHSPAYRVAAGCFGAALVTSLVWGIAALVHHLRKDRTGSVTLPAVDPPSPTST